MQALQLFLLEKDRIDSLHNFFFAIVEFSEQILVLALKLLKIQVYLVLAISFCLAHRGNSWVVELNGLLQQCAFLVQGWQRLSRVEKLPVLRLRELFRLGAYGWIVPACEDFLPRLLGKCSRQTSSGQVLLNQNGYVVVASISVKEGRLVRPQILALNVLRLVIWQLGFCVLTLNLLRR